MNQKQQLRKEMLAYREQLPKEQIQSASAQVCRQLVELPQYQQAKKILFYMAIKNEIDLMPLMEQAWLERRQVILPRVNGKVLECVQVDKQDALQKSSFGIPEPKTGKMIDPGQIDLVLVPGIAFDVQGYRLGFGAGHYDRLFSQYPHLKRVGILEHGQLVPTIYPEPHDQSMHLLVTSQQVLTIKENDHI